MTTSMILSIGEAMVELSQAGKDGLWQVGIAGDTLNTAWYLRRLLSDDWQVGYFTRVGSGEFSQRMIDFLTAEGIDTAHVGRDSQREIGLYAISLKDGERSFSYWRDNSAAKGLADDPGILTKALTGTRIAYLSGITMAILPDEARMALLQVLREARAQGTQIVFDPNLRPKLWPDTTTMCDRIEAAAAISDLILPSFDDEREYFGDSDPQATVSRYLKRGAGQVIVKAGGDAIRFGGSEGEGLIDDLERETPVDTTSAGDSFNAGYLAAKLQGAYIRAAIRAGHALSRQVIRHRGALVREAVLAVQAGG
ncbi:sugar kinase [Paracoccus methylarcula]|uniref:Sugar kinase n=1 Tax=Paracoccus methylarcula TaxID=72022 RepID=A0A3R7Q3C1_9RHOB|nr:sugar kinase [Paracoccus methylarcula]RNF35121.1 sugar kinase [Paracoccus methylarcula]